MKMRHALQLALCLASLATALPGGALAQQVADGEVFADDVATQDGVNQRTPLRTTQGFMRFAELSDYDSAAQYLDLRFLPEEVAASDAALLAEQLYVVISRKMQISLGALSDEPGGVEGDGLPSYRDVLGTIATPQGDLRIYLQLIPGAEDTRVWKVSNASVARIPELYKEYGYSPLVEAVREFVPQGSFLGVEFFKWVIAVLSGLLAALAWLLAAWPLSGVLTRRNPANKQRVKRYLMGPLPTLIFVLVGASVLRNLGLGVTGSRIYEGGTLITIAVVWLLFATINLLRDLYSQFLQARGRHSGLMLLRPVTSTVKVLVSTLAIVIWLDNMGVNVTALMAGLGVGGLAVALVLQKPLEDILGAITLYTQQPVTVGQFCTCGTVTGTVEAINLRTTRIRTIKNTIVVMPNALFATASIENITERDRILHRQTVRLALDTPESTIKTVLQNLREMLAAIDKVAVDAWRVRLTGFGKYSIDVEVFAHVETTDWAEFLAVAEDINLGTIGSLESAGARLANPLSIEEIG